MANGGAGTTAGSAPVTAGASAAGANSNAGGGTGGSGTSAGAAGSAGSGGQTGGSAGAPADDPNLPKPSAGCNVSDAFADGAHEIAVGDLTRQYSLTKPDGYDAAAKKAWPLVLALHPNGSAMDYWNPATGSRAIRPLLKDKAIVVMPQARNDDWRGDLPADLAYFDSMIQELAAKLCIDQTRVLSLGHSGGGSFSGVLGCHRTDVRAIAASGSVIYFDEADCVGKPAAWITIGVDEAIPERIEYRDFFRTFAGCAETSKASEPEGCVLYDCPSAERPVEFCSHPGGHEWPDYGATASVDFFEQFL